MKTSVLPGRKWSEALTKRKTDRHKECSLLLLIPGCTDMASLTLVASIKFTATDEKRSAALLARYLKKYWHRLYLSHNQDKQIKHQTRSQRYTAHMCMPLTVGLRGELTATLATRPKQGCMHKCFHGGRLDDDKRYPSLEQIRFTSRSSCLISV